MAHHRLIAHPLVLRQVQVARVQDVTARMRRVTLVGSQLGAFERDGLELPPLAGTAFDDHLKLIFASDGDLASALPVQLPNGIEWTPAPNRLGRDYTPRRVDPVAGELDLDFVLHGDGPAATWALHAAPGDDLWFVGPKSSTILPEDCDWALLAGDETALPAIGRFFAERPLEVPVRAVITVAEESARQELALRPEDQVQWIIAPAEDPRALSEAVAALAPLPGRPYVWAAAESQALLPLRRHVSRVLEVPKSHVDIVGYWHRRPETETATANAAPAPAALPAPPIAWFAIRSALRLGMLDALDVAPTPPTELATAIGIAPAQLSVLTEALSALEVLVVDDAGRLTLGPLGMELSVDEHAREHYVGLRAKQVLALEALPAALTGDVSAWELAQQRSLRAAVADDAELYEELIEEGESLTMLITSLNRREVWGRGRRIAVTGPGAIPVADCLRAGADARVTVLEDPAPLAVLREEATPGSAHVFSARPEPQDVVATALALGHRTEAEAVVLLRELHEVAPVAVLIERLSPDALDRDAAAQQSLLQVAATGTAFPDPGRLSALAAEAGWRVAAHEGLGWGVECVELIASAS